MALTVRPLFPSDRDMMGGFPDGLTFSPPTAPLAVRPVDPTPDAE
jgi:hypothetical protein